MECNRICAPARYRILVLGVLKLLLLAGTWERAVAHQGKACRPQDDATDGEARFPATTHRREPEEEDQPSLMQTYLSQNGLTGSPSSGSSSAAAAPTASPAAVIATSVAVTGPPSSGSSAATGASSSPGRAPATAGQAIEAIVAAEGAVNSPLWMTLWMAACEPMRWLSSPPPRLSGDDSTAANVTRLYAGLCFSWAMCAVLLALLLWWSNRSAKPLAGAKSGTTSLSIAQDEISDFQELWVEKLLRQGPSAS